MIGIDYLFIRDVAREKLTGFASNIETEISEWLSAATNEYW